MKLLDNGMVELVAGDLRHTMPGMPCSYLTSSPRIFEGVSFDNNLILKNVTDNYTFAIPVPITARLRDWQVYTARRVFEMNPVANYITPGRWWKTQPAYHDGQWYPGEYGEEMDPDNWGVNGPVNIPDIWAGTPDDQAISREEVEDDEK